MTHKLFTAALLALALLTSLSANAASKEEIDANVEEALAKFYEESPAGRRLAQEAVALLVFPRVIKAGVGIGGEYGEGSLLRNGQPIAYYNTVSASIGFQLGAQVKSQIIMFMTDEALEDFRSTEGWEAGVDGSVAIVEFGVGEEINTNSVQDPIIGFVFSNRGLMYNLTFEGAKMTEIDR
ncbi:MAG: hypothetical protein RLZZ385_1155 [Pseudomonadota bacterium]|jgi:lipid-binding SYLF domain-containing protein